MTTSVVHRLPRAQPLQPTSGDVRLSSPPSNLGKKGGSVVVQLLLPLLGSGAGLLMMLTRPQPLFLLGGGAMAATSVISAGASFAQGRSTVRKRAAEIRARYTIHVSDARNQLAEAARVQIAAEAWRHPSPDRLPLLVRDPRRLWERRRTDDDFLSVRVGTGNVPLLLAPRVEGLDNPMNDPDPVCGGLARRLVEQWSSVDDQPLAVDLSAGPLVVVRGRREQSVALVRAMLAQAAVLHAPNDLQILVAAGASRLDDWAWCKWLPHVQDEDASDDTGTARLLASDELELIAAAGVLVTAGRSGATPHVLAIVDGFPYADRVGDLLDAAGVVRTVVQLVERDEDEPSDPAVRIELGIDGSLSATTGERRVRGRVDVITTDAAESLARQLAPLRLTADSAGLALTTTLEVQDLLGIGDVALLDPQHTWARRSPADFLRVPFGVGPSGEPVRLDLKESAQGGHGPHGLLIGATGSGKSELLRTVLAGLVATHPPDLLAMVLVDFKGGAAFAGLSELPHVAGIITNLADDTSNVARMRDALIGEQRRRQEMLASAGNLANVREYQQLRARSRPDLEPMPNLLVVIDEFSELLSQNPEFIDVFVGIGRLGRSLGIHLLFSSQRLEEGRLRGLDSHLSYRLGLRTFSAAESRTVLGVTDAYELPPIPGSGFLKVDTTVWERFKAALVSAPYRPPSAAADEEAPPPPQRFLPVTATASVPSAPTVEEDEVTGPAVLDVIVGRLKDAAPKVHQIWVPPLPTGLPLDAIPHPAPGRLRAAIGIVDKPLEQRTDALVLDFSGADGHLAVVGGPQSGKSTTLRTVLASLAVGHAPTEVQFHGVDLGGGGLRTLADLPHVGTIAGRLDPELARRVVGEVHAQLRAREECFGREGIDSIVEFRRRRAEGGLREEPYGDLFLVIDGWAAFKQEFEDLEPAIIEIATRGLGYGIHLLLSANRWIDLRAALKDAVGGRIELRLNDPGDSDIDRKVAGAIAGASPGRGLTRDKLQCQVSLPRNDGVANPASVGAGTEALVGALRGAWPGPGAPEVRLLPPLVKIDDLPSPAERVGEGVPIGISDLDLGPAMLDLGGLESNLVILGDSQSGKTSFLRMFARQLCERHPSTELQILVIDYRRTLLEVVPEDHLLAYVGAAPAAQEAVVELRRGLEKRLPTTDLTAKQLRERSWWSGPEVYILVDDYDLVGTQAGNPLTPLLDLLPQARDIGIHLVLARRSAGASRALYEPFLQRVRELGAPHLLLSGDPSEGPIVRSFKLTPQPPGRGVLVRRNRGELVQTAYVEEAAV